MVPGDSFSEPLTTNDVLSRERGVIHERRTQAGYEPADGARVDGLTGLALSGGGIRSATFCLGVLQALQDAGALKAFDYLSTVSGGGFAGSWWTVWLSRTQTNGLFPAKEGIVLGKTGNPALREVEVDLESAGQDPVRHLRLFSNYLTPKKGLLSADTWRAVAVVSRNLFLTWSVLLPVLLCAILVGDLYFVGLDPSWLTAAGHAALTERAYLLAGVVAAFLGWLAVLTITWMQANRPHQWLALAAPWVGLSVLFATGLAVINQAALGSQSQGPVAPTSRVEETRRLITVWGGWLVDTRVGWVVLAWMVIAALLVLYATRGTTDVGRSALVRNQIVRTHATVMVIGIGLTAFLAVSGFGHELFAFLFRSEPTWARQGGGWAAIVGTVSSAVFTAWKTAPTAAGDQQAPSSAGRATTIVLAIAPPAVLIMFAVILAWASHATLVRLADNGDPALRLLHYGTVVGIGLAAIYAWQEALSLPVGWQWLNGVQLAAVGLAVAAYVELILQPDLWLDRTVEGLSLAAGIALWATIRRQFRPQPFAANTRPVWLLIGGFAAVVSLGLCRDWGPAGQIALVLNLIYALFAWVLAYGWMADPNLLSLHEFYHARLTRAYLGASNANRGGESIAQADGGDDLRLTALTSTARGGPYHLINATLNLVGGRDLATAQRSSDRFIFSQLHCGSSRTLYRPTELYMGGELNVGTAVAVSGAAVSPEMGSSSPTAALAMLMTLLNVRLGYWAATPNKARWFFGGASLWPFYLLYEFLSQTNELSSYCYLTDGGHFDNTGLYSLVERGCRNIVCLDCGADALPCFEDLGTALRRCRIDFGTEIDIDLEALRRSPIYAKARIISGSIHYGDAHAKAIGLSDDARDGILVVIKPALTGKEAAADVRQYGFQNEAFPQQTTADQWFDEAQFESYRRLGELSGLRVVNAARPAFATAPRMTPAGVNSWFASLKQQTWTE